MFSGIFRAYFDADESDRTNQSSSLFKENRKGGITQEISKLKNTSDHDDTWVITAKHIYVYILRIQGIHN